MVFEGREDLPGPGNLLTLLDSIVEDPKESDSQVAFLRGLQSLAQMAMGSFGVAHDQPAGGWKVYVCPWMHDFRENGVHTLLEKIADFEVLGGDPSPQIRGVVALVGLQLNAGTSTWQERTWQMLGELRRSQALPADLRTLLSTCLGAEDLTPSLLVRIRQAEHAQGSATAPSAGRTPQAQPWSRSTTLMRNLNLLAEHPDPDVPPPSPLMAFSGRALPLAFQDEAIEPFLRSPGGPVSFVESTDAKVAKGHRAFADAWRVAGEMCLNRAVRLNPRPDHIAAAVCAGIALAYLGVRYDPEYGGCLVQSLEAIQSRKDLAPRLQQLAMDLVHAIRCGVRENGSVPFLQTLPEDRVLQVLQAELPECSVSEPPEDPTPVVGIDRRGFLTYNGTKWVRARVGTRLNQPMGRIYDSKRAQFVARLLYFLEHRIDAPPSDRYFADGTAISWARRACEEAGAQVEIKGKKPHWMATGTVRLTRELAEIVERRLPSNLRAK